MDFWLVRRKQWRVPDFYRGKGESIYWFTAGLNWRAFTAWSLAVWPSFRKSLVLLSQIGDILLTPTFSWVHRRDWCDSSLKELAEMFLCHMDHRVLWSGYVVLCDMLRGTPAWCTIRDCPDAREYGRPPQRHQRADGGAKQYRCADAGAEAAFTQR